MYWVYWETLWRLSWDNKLETTTQKTGCKLCFKSTKQGLLGLTETQMASMRLAWVWAMYSAYMSWLLTWWFFFFMGILTGRTGVSLTLCLLLRSFCYYLVTLSSCDRNTLALSYCILIFPIWLLSFGGLPFSGEEEEEWTLGRRDVGFLKGVEWRETVVGMYCIRKKTLFFNKKFQGK